MSNRLFNHYINKVSELDMRMIVSISEGGNWKDIPHDIPSKRLDGIRRTGGRTTLYGRLKRDKPAYTVNTYFTRPGNGTFIHPIHHRLITPREAANSSRSLIAIGFLEPKHILPLKLAMLFLLCLPTLLQQK